MQTVDRGDEFHFVRSERSKLYDFQEEAVRHCVDRLRCARRAVLSLDTGLGKTCVVRKVLDELKLRALVVVPGGLVRQVARSLACFPWETQPSTRVRKAETGRELQAAADAEDHAVLVVNRALRLGQEIMTFYEILVVDEVHQRQSITAVRKLGADRLSLPSFPTLFLTATPEDSWTLPEILYGRRSFWDPDGEKLVFSIRKTQRVMDLLGVAKPRPRLLDLALPNPGFYDEGLLRLMLRPHFPAVSGLRLLLAIGEHIPRLRISAKEKTQELFERSEHSKMPLGLISDILAFVNGETPQEGASKERRGFDKNPVCGCCGLTIQERQTLARYQERATPTPPPPWTHASLGAMSAIVRFPTKKDLEDALARHPIPRQVAVYALTSDKGAAYRAKLIQRFASRDGLKLKLAVLNRALQQGNGSNIFLQTFSLDFFIPEIKKYLDRPRLLVADSTVDVGFDLHRHVDGIYVPRLPSDCSELRQIVGRVSRIAADKANQGSLDVISHHYTGTADKILWHHLEHAIEG